jgi:hypothetical protein
MLAKSGGQEDDRCPAPDEMLALLHGEGGEEERLATLDHVMACNECSREFELLDVLNRESGAARERAGVVPLRRRASWRRYAPVALAASLLIVVGVGVLSRDAGRDAGDVTRGDLTTVTLIAPATEVQEGAPLEFVWSPIPDALEYRLEVLDASGNVAYSATTSDTTVTASQANLTPGTDYRWWVRVATRAGDQRLSEIRRLRVRRE